MPESRTDGDRIRTEVLRGALRSPGSKRYLTDSGLQLPMVVMRRISGAGRGLLVLGAALLLVSLFGNLVFPSTYVAWFTLSGNQPQLPAGAYTGIQVTELLNTLVSGPFARDHGDLGSESLIQGPGSIPLPWRGYGSTQCARRDARKPMSAAKPSRYAHPRATCQPGIMIRPK